jgi:hypothetical protein
MRAEELAGEPTRYRVEGPASIRVGYDVEAVPTSVGHALEFRGSAEQLQEASRRLGRPSRSVGK